MIATFGLVSVRYALYSPALCGYPLRRSNCDESTSFLAALPTLAPRTTDLFFAERLRTAADDDP